MKHPKKRNNWKLNQQISLTERVNVSKDCFIREMGGYDNPNVLIAVHQLEKRLARKEVEC